MISVKDLKKDYEIKRGLFKPAITTVNALKGVSFSIEDGETVGLIGLNGAGKSTLLKILSGILKPSSGVVTVDGYIPYERKNKFLTTIGVVMGQRSILFYDIPVKDSLKFYKEVYGIGDELYNKRIALYNEILHLDEIYETPVRKLSFGQRMRAELCASILHNPKLIFLDEPTVGLDILAKDEMIQFLDRLNKEFNTTIILTTHNIDEIEKFCRRVILVDNGTIVFDGDGEVLTHTDSKKNIKFRNFGLAVTEFEPFGTVEILEDGYVQIRAENDKTASCIDFLTKNNLSNDISITNDSLEMRLKNYYRASPKTLSDF
ncbi:ABC transporter ATP-binding protein [Treponema pedis]|uniref:ABC transporter ATP-binding protein n=1 Tax=Treponema pedis TaxID=409322 RepID=UPI00041A8C24|nr:ATP-binding cassette domain-containing protein [Treponema pedis]